MGVFFGQCFEFKYKSKAFRITVGISLELKHSVGIKKYGSTERLMVALNIFNSKLKCVNVCRTRPIIGTQSAGKGGLSFGD